MSDSPTLFALVAEYKDLSAQIASLDLDEATIQDTLEGAAYPVEQKAVACLAVAGNIASQAEMYKARAKELADHAKALENRAGWLRDYVRAGMLQAGISEVKGPDFTARLQQNPPRVVIDAESQIPWLYWREKVIRELDKDAIKEALKDGDEELGKAAHLERGWSLRIR